MLQLDDAGTRYLVQAAAGTAQKREEERQRREIAQRQHHVMERRGAALDEVLEELAALDRLRRLVEGLRRERTSDGAGRVEEFLAFAEGRLAARETALSAAGLGKRFEDQRVFGDDDDHGFRPPFY
jgi:hypothetical protein